MARRKLISIPQPTNYNILNNGKTSQERLCNDRLRRKSFQNSALGSLHASFVLRYVHNCPTYPDIFEYPLFNIKVTALWSGSYKLRVTSLQCLKSLIHHRKIHLLLLPCHLNNRLHHACTALIPDIEFHPSLRSSGKHQRDTGTSRACQHGRST